MAAPDRSPAQHLSFLGDTVATIRKWGLFALVRGAESRAPSLPRVGSSRLPSQNIVDLSQTPSLSFADTTLDTVEIRAGRAHVSGYWLGLTGPMGPMPSHISEFAIYEKKYAKTRPFGRFMDMLSGRMLQFFYRAWADSQPAVMADRPEDDRFAAYIAALTGAYEGAAENSSFPARARLHYAGLFASQRNARGIEDALSHLLRQPVTVLEFQPRWRDVEAEDRSRLGHAFVRLGSDIFVGRRVRTASDAFRVVIRANTMREYESLLPTGARFAIVAEALDAFAPSHLEWDIALELEERLVPPLKLDGRGRLGWTSWVARKGAKANSRTIRRDTIVKRQAVKPKAATTTH